MTDSIRFTDLDGIVAEFEDAKQGDLLISVSRKDASLQPICLLEPEQIMALYNFLGAKLGCAVAQQKHAGYIERYASL